MWLHQELWLVSDVEARARLMMEYFDRCGRMYAEHWRNDPSYHWAAQRKRNKEAKPMSIKVYDEDCPGCKPAALDPTTGKLLPDDHPLMQRILRAWGQTTRAQREAWHRCTCQNSRDARDMQLAQQFISAIQQDA
jgi:hypothetical protein